MDSAPTTVSIEITALPCVAFTPTREFTINVDRSKAGSIRPGKIKTKKNGELLVAFVAVNGRLAERT